jgi:hypothetical protein
LVARADHAISELDEPPDYLIALSLGEPLLHVDQLDLVKFPLTRKDLGGLAIRLLERLESETIGLEEIATVAARISFPRDDAMIDAWTQFDWITDEMDLIEHGIKDDSEFRDGVIAALRQASRYANE